MSNFEQVFKNICQARGVVGANVLIIKDNKIVEQVTYGYQDLEDKILTLPNTIYRIASVSKVEVALAIMKLYENKQLDLDKDISVYLGFKVRNPHFPNDIITIRMLMTQTSSITDGFDDEDLSNEVRRDGYNGVNGTNLKVTLKDLLVPNDSIYYSEVTFLNHKPGTQFCYSNFGCGILACIVEKISGMYFTDYVQKNVLDLLKIDASFRIDQIKAFDQIASLYIPSGDNYKLCRNKTMFMNGLYERFPLGENFRGPAGGLFISIPDLAKIMIMLINKGNYNNKQVFSEETIDEMLKKNWQGPRDGNYEAKGLQMIIRENYHGHCVWGHYGNAYGLTSFMLFNPTEKIGICFANNGNCSHYLNSGDTDLHDEIFKAFAKEYWS